MSPVLKDGDAILIAPREKVSEGDIVLAAHPFQQSVKILKRLKNFTETGDLYLVGDNPAESTDSRTFGAVPSKNLIGKASCRLK